MKYNENKELEKIEHSSLGSSNFNLWGAPILYSNILKSKNKKGGELEGLT